MADPNEIDLLRLLAAEPDTSPTFDDPTLGKIIDEEDGDVNAAASRVWGIKAGNAASGYSVTLDGATLTRDQIFNHCMRMKDYYLTLSGEEIESVLIEVNPPFGGETTSAAEFG